PSPLGGIGLGPRSSSIGDGADTRTAPAREGAGAGWGPARRSDVEPTGGDPAGDEPGGDVEGEPVPASGEDDPPLSGDPGDDDVATVDGDLQAEEGGRHGGDGGVEAEVGQLGDDRVRDGADQVEAGRGGGGVRVPV